MNRQPFQTPPQWWPPQMRPWFVRLWRPMIRRALTKHQRIRQIEVQGLEHVRGAIRDNAGVLITPNHSFHYDSYAVIEAAHRAESCFHFMSAWQVFAMSKPLERKVLQWHGTFSVNREGNDVQAFKQAVDILRESPFPLVIFPEGDIYHHNDRITPFRDGAAAIAMSAARKGPRQVVVVPTALKCFYVSDPTQELADLMSRLEASLHWRPRPREPLPQRIYKLAEGLLTLKEIEYEGEPRRGTVRQRMTALADSVLGRLEAAHGVKRKSDEIPERVKEVRRAIISSVEQDGISADDALRLAHQMDDLFFVTQLFSYPGDYISERPSLERIAETLDKFEEDVLNATYPGVRGERHAVVRFGEPLAMPHERDSRNAVAEWTDILESKVQQLLDEINAARPASAPCLPNGTPS